MKTYNISPVSKEIEKELQHKINTRTKPVGSLGKLESTVMKIGLIQNSLSPKLNLPHHILFAGDHGVVEMGVSPDKMEVTKQMVFNFLQGGAAINVFCQQNQIELILVDSGVNYDFGIVEGIIDLKVGMGTKNYYYEPAMCRDELLICFERAGTVVDKAFEKGSNIIGFGEMGITNTSSSSLIMSALCGINLKECVGIGAGHTREGVEHKYKILSEVQNKFSDVKDPLEVLRYFGGFEVAMMTGAMLRAAELGMTIMIDGFISTASFIVAHALYPQIIDYAIFCHLSKEGGHRLMLDFLEVDALLDLELRLGEGTAVALAYPLIQNSVDFLNRMASFDGANVRLPDNLR